MTKLSKSKTIKSIEETIYILNDAVSYMTCIGELSEHVQQSRFEQFITTTEETIQSLTKIKENL